MRYYLSEVHKGDVSIYCRDLVESPYHSRVTAILVLKELFPDACLTYSEGGGSGGEIACAEAIDADGARVLVGLVQVNKTDPPWPCIPTSEDA